MESMASKKRYSGRPRSLEGGGGQITSFTGIRSLIGYGVLMLSLFWVDAATAQSEDESQEGRSSALETVTVTARRSIEDRFLAAGSMVVIDRKDIESLGAFSVTDVLRQLPGVHVSPTADGNVVIRMRGMDAGSTQILIDGQRVSNGKSQLPIDQLPAEMLERIEVIRAPTAEFSGASGGTLNIVLRQASAERQMNIRATDNHALGRNAGQIFFSSSGPLGPQRKKGDQAADLGDTAPWNYLVSLASTGSSIGSDVHRLTTQNGFLSGDTNTGSRYRRLNNSLLPRVNGKIGSSDLITLRATLSHTGTSGGTAGAGFGTDAQGGYQTQSNEAYEYKRDYVQIAADWTHRFEKSKLETTISRGQSRDNIYRTGEIDRTYSAKQSTEAYIFSDSPRDDLLLLKTKLSGTADPLLWSVGAEFESRDLVAATNNTDSFTGIRSLNLSTSSRKKVIWAQKEWEMPGSSTLTGGLRGENLTLKSGNSLLLENKSWSFFQPSLHFKTPLGSDAQFRVNLARVTKNPTLWELIDRKIPSFGVNSIANPDFLGNPNLRPETAWTTDWGIERRIGDDGQMGLNFFARDLKNTIATVVNNNGMRWVQQRVNAGDAFVWGLEADVKSKLTALGFSRDWSMSSHASLLQSRLTSGPNAGERIPGQARYVASVNIAKPMRRAAGYFGGVTLSASGPSELNSSPGIRGRESAHANLDVFFGERVSSRLYWRVGVNNIGRTSYNRERSYSDSNGDLIGNYSSLVLAPRVYFSVGMDIK